MQSVSIVGSRLPRHIEKVLIKHEGLRLRRYKDDVGLPTIGVGHFISNASKTRQKIQRVTGKSSKQVDAIINGSASLTKSQAMALLKLDAKDKMQFLNKSIPRWKTYPINVQQAIISGAFRGDIAPGYKVTKHLAKGRFKEASKEIRRTTNYDPKRPGIKKRIDELSDVFKKEHSRRLTSTAKTIGLGTIVVVAGAYGLKALKNHRRQKQVTSHSIALNGENIANNASKNHKASPKQMKRKTVTRSPRKQKASLVMPSKARLTVKACPTVSQLRTMAKEQKVKGYSKMRKAELCSIVYF